MHKFLLIQAPAPTLRKPWAFLKGRADGYTRNIKEAHWYENDDDWAERLIAAYGSGYPTRDGLIAIHKARSEEEAWALIMSIEVEDVG